MRNIHKVVRNRKSEQPHNSFQMPHYFKENAEFEKPKIL